MNLSFDLQTVLTSAGIDPNSYGPAYGGESVGWDLYNTGPNIVIQPGTTELIPTGLRIALERNTVGLLRERGSATKSNLILRAGVIDPGYTGEIFVGLTYIPQVQVLGSETRISKPIQILFGQKLTVQLLILPCVPVSAVTRVDMATYMENVAASKRGNAALGSSDKS